MAGPTYADPVMWKRKENSPLKKDDGYINTAKCVAYRQNLTPGAAATAGATLNSLSLTRGSNPRPTSQSDEYEVMQQLKYKGDIYLT